MKVRHKYIEKQLLRLSESHSELGKIPVNIGNLLKSMGVYLVEEEFGDSLSGAAMIDGNKKIVSINKAHSENRKRFTMAHELGHILLHEDQSLSVDVTPVTFLRSDNSSSGDDWREVEANLFAASLLIPQEQIFKDIALHKNKNDTETLIEMLASMYKVSIQAMTIRLTRLKAIE